VDELYDEKFSSEQLLGKLTNSFTVLAIVISCLGLFGLASFSAEQRRKEIGIRKVLGASVRNLWFNLSKEFIVLVTHRLCSGRGVQHVFYGAMAAKLHLPHRRKRMGVRGNHLHQPYGNINNRKLAGH
jgi:predicted MFS family arabinose efflux permease